LGGEKEGQKDGRTQYLKKENEGKKNLVGLWETGIGKMKEIHTHIPFLLYSSS